jgi:hypothetical protein
MTGAPLIDITHLRRASGGQRINARSSKEPDGSLLTPPEMFGKRTNSGHISHRPQHARENEVLTDSRL